MNGAKNKGKKIKLVWTRLKTARQYTCKHCIKRSTEICKETKRWTKVNMNKND